jgi:dimethylhistidine N-methyltransferase
MSSPARVLQPITEFAADVFAGLSKSGQKELPSKYLYDDLGTTLFEVITLLPEYGLTRAEERLFERHSSELVARLPGAVVVAELGSGTGRKTRWLLEALGRRQTTSYFPIDLSPAALLRCEREFSGLESVKLAGLASPYLEGLREVARRRPAGAPLLVLFMGSTIGNLERPVMDDFLRDIRALLAPGDGFLLSTDLEKPVAQLLAAYDDSIGVTAAFNLNLLLRINRELDGEFDLSRFRHEARWKTTERRIEMHLRSICPQTVRIPRAGLVVDFALDETIWTESSHRFNCREVEALGERAGFRCDAQWVDAEWPFAQSLLIAR